MTQSNTIDINKAISDINKNVKYYTLSVEPGARSEDGRTDCLGYIVNNKVTGVTEFTSTVLPNAIYQMQHLDEMLDSLVSPREKVEPLSLVNPVGEDTVPH